MKEKRVLHYAWVVLFVCIVVNIVLNAIFSSAGSVFLPYLMEDFQAGAGTIQLRLTVHSIVVVLMMPFVGKLYKKHNFKILLLFGIICYLGAFFGFSFCSNVYLYIALGALQGVGSAFSIFIPATYMINAWFKKKNGLAFALYNCMVYILAVFTTPIVQKMVTGNGWRYTYRFWSIIGLIISVPIVSLLCVSTPQEKGMLPYGEEEKNGKKDKGTKERQTIKGVKASVAKRSTAFWMFFFLTIVAQAYNAIARFLSPICISHGLSAEQAAYCVSAYSLGGGIGGLIIGMVFDKLGVKLSTFLFGAVDMAAMLLLLLGKDSMAALTAGSFLLAFAGMNYTINIGTKDVFGMLDYVDIYATITVGLNIALIICPTLFGYIYDWLGSYDMIFIICMVLVLVGTLATEVIYRTKGNIPVEEKNVE